MPASGLPNGLTKGLNLLEAPIGPFRFTPGKLFEVENKIRELLEKLFSTTTQIDFDKNAN